MRTQTINIYKYDELSDRAKEAARDWWRQGALDYDWWDCIFDDAVGIGLKINEFDAGRSSLITGDFINKPDDTTAKILAEHGEDTPTAAEARYYQKTMAEFMATAEKDEDGELATYALDDEKLGSEADFRHALLQQYLTALRNEEEYQLSDEVAEETIRANEYEFWENGKPA